MRDVTQRAAPLDNSGDGEQGEQRDNADEAVEEGWHNGTGYSKQQSSLSPAHVELIVKSGISPVVLQMRGYRTETVKQRLKDLGFSSSQLLVPALVVPLFNARGEIVNHQIRPDQPRLGDNGKPRKYETPARSRAVIDVHPALSRPLKVEPKKPADPIESPAPIHDVRMPLIITEGSRKADSAVSCGLCAVALLGVAAWHRLPDWNDFPLKGRDIFLCFDSDAMQKREVWIQLRDLKAWLQSHGASVCIIYLPVGQHGEKVELDDWIAARKRESSTEADIREKLLGLATSELRQRPGEDLNKTRHPGIFVDGSQLREKVREAIAALAHANEPPLLFCRGGLLTRVRENTGSVELETFDDAALLSELSEAANWYRHSRSGESIDVDPPANVIRAVRGARSLPFPIIDAVVHAPFFAPDGTLITTSGYHYGARVYVWLDKTLAEQLAALVLPQRPKPQDVTWARSLLLDELFHDFPFVDQASIAHVVALTLLPFVRKMIDGPTPNHAVDAPARGEGTGKGLLVQAACAPGLGEIAAIPETRDEDELRKFLLSILIEGTPIALLDNRRHEVNSGVLAAVLTASRWQDRILGKSKTARPTVLTTWVITGNAFEFR